VIYITFSDGFEDICRIVGEKTTRRAVD